MKSIFLIAAVAAIASTGAYALRSGDSGAATPGKPCCAGCCQTADVATMAACKCGEDCKCDPCKCPKTDATAVSATCEKCGENCKCDPCNCPKGDANALAACTCPGCGSDNCTDCQCTDCQCPLCDCGECGEDCPCDACDCSACKCCDGETTTATPDAS